MIKKLFFICALINFVSAQNHFDVFQLFTNTTPLSKFDSSNSSTRVNEIMSDLTVPIKLSNNFAIITGAIYETVNVKLFANDSPINLNALSIKAGLTGKINDKWSGIMIFLPKAATNNLQFNAGYQLGGIGYFKYKKTETLNFRLGLYANSDLFGPLFVPMAGMYYLSPNKKFETTLMMPFQADAAYHFNSHFDLGFNYNAQVKTFYLFNIKPTYNNSYVTKSTDDLFLYAKYNINKNYSIQARIGQSVARDYRVFDTKDKVTLGLPAIYIGNHRHQLNTDFKNSLIFQLVFVYRVNIHKEKSN
ncbi:MAG: hypothetical protein JSU07_04695 [Bacteroidetes bacterium]|nr:hypothetical protein [Bacteroidota bacterium]